MATTKLKALKKLWKNEYVQTAVIIGLIVLIVFGFWFGSQLVLNTPIPAVAVVSGSMCIPYDGLCNGWTHPFDRTLHIGDLLIIQGVDPKTLNANYPDSDIIVFQDPERPNDPDAKIVHRIVAKDEVNGVLYFRTKGDGNSVNKWPATPQTAEYDPFEEGSIPGVSENHIYGKVIMRVPWIGHVVLFMNPKTNPWGWFTVIFLVILLVVVEFIVPILRGKKVPATSPEQRKKTDH